MHKFGLIGEKLGHTLSPGIHMEIMRERGIDGSYDVIEIPRESFDERFTALKHSGYDGLNVTIPYKELVMPLLDYIDEKASLIGAVNTVRFENGFASGYNTDYYGFLAMLGQNNVEIDGKDALILGSGGAAKMVIKALADNGIKSMTLLSRKKQNFTQTRNLTYQDFLESPGTFDIIINCTPIGMFPNDRQSPLPKESIHSKIAVDLIYNPEKTLFLQYAEAEGAKAINGYTMLYLQAVAAQGIWSK